MSSKIKLDYTFHTYKLVKTIKEVHQLIRYTKQTKICSFDFETTGFAPKVLTEHPTCIGISFQPGSAWVVPLYHDESPFKKIYPKILRLLSVHLFENTDIIKIAQNAKFEHKWLKRYGCDIRGVLHDTMLMKYALDEEKPHDLKVGIVSVLLPHFAGYDDEIDVLKKKYGWAKIPMEPLSRYNALDADLTLRSWLIMMDSLRSNDLYQLYRNLLMMAHRVLTESEHQGFNIDLKELAFNLKNEKKKIDKTERIVRSLKIIRKFDKWRKNHHIQKLIEATNQEIEDIQNDKSKTPAQKSRLINARNEKVSRYIAGDLQTKKEKVEPVNFGSVKQMCELLYTSPAGFEFDVIKKTDAGNPSTDEDTLVELQPHDSTGFITKLLRLRGLRHIYNTFIAGLDEKRIDDKVYGSFLIHGTVTGRLSSKEPNLQQIPRDTTSSIIKRMYLPPPGYLILQVDYSQAELRVMAELANEETMLEWFNTGKDIHLATACKKWDFDYDEAKKILEDSKHSEYKNWKIRRKQAKTINFGIIYEQGARKLAESLSDPESGIFVPVPEAKQFLKEYFELFPRVERFVKKQHKKAERDLYVKNLFGRYRRLFYDEQHRDEQERDEPWIYAQKLRQATNSPIQGTASDFALFSSVLIREEKIKGNLPWDMKQIFTVHDSIGFIIQPKDIHKVVPKIESICADPLTKQWFGFQMKKVKMKVDVEIGERWGTLKPYDSSIDYTKLKG